MAKSILQDVAGTVVSTITEIPIKHRLDAIVMTYEEVMAYRSKELQDSLLTFKTYINANNKDLKTSIDSLGVDITEIKSNIEALGNDYINNIATIYKYIGTDKKEYRRYNYITNTKIDQIPYDFTLSKIIGPSFVQYTVDQITKFKTVRKDNFSGTDLYSKKYLYFKDSQTESLDNMSTTDRSFATLFGLFYGLNSILAFDNLSRTIYLGESDDTNASTNGTIKTTVQGTSLYNLIFPNGKTTLRGDTQIDKTLNVKKQSHFESTSQFDDDIVINDGDITVKDDAENIVFSLTSNAGIMILNKQATISGTGLSADDNALLLSKGSLTLSNGNVNLGKGSLTLSEGSATLTKGDMTLTKGNLTLSEGNMNINGHSYYDNAKAIYIKASGASDGTSASSLISNNKLYIAQNSEAIDVKLGASLTLSNTRLDLNSQFYSNSTLVAKFAGSLISVDGFAVAGSGGGNLFKVDSSGNVVTESIKTNAGITSLNGISTFIDLHASALSITGSGYISSTLTVDGKLTGNSSCDFQDGSSVGGCSFTSGVMTGTATKAQYADLAEYYTTDKKYEPGTVLCYSTNLFEEGVLYRPGGTVLGVVSENPAFIMNEKLNNDSNFISCAIVLKGRSPVKFSRAADNSYVVPGNIAVACDENLGSVIAISTIEFNKNRQYYENRYIGRILSTIIDPKTYTIEVKF